MTVYRDREGELWEQIDVLPEKLPIGRSWLADTTGPWMKTLNGSTIMPITHADPMSSAQRYGPFVPVEQASASDGASILPCCDGRRTHGHIGCVWPTGTGEPATECLYGSDCGNGVTQPCWHKAPPREQDKIPGVRSSGCLPACGFWGRTSLTPFHQAGCENATPRERAFYAVMGPHGVSNPATAWHLVRAVLDAVSEGPHGSTCDVCGNAAACTAGPR